MLMDEGRTEGNGLSGGHFALFSIFRCGDGNGESGIYSHTTRIEGGTGGGVIGIEKGNPVKTTGEGPSTLSTNRVR